MTKVKFFTNSENYFTKIEVSGHTGYDEAGKDILCAALSGIVQACALGILNVCNVKANVEKNDSIGYFMLELPNKISNEKLKETQIVFLTMFEGVKDLQKGYSKYIKLEVK